MYTVFVKVFGEKVERSKKVDFGSKNSFIFRFLKRKLYTILLSSTIEMCRVINK